MSSTERPTSVKYSYGAGLTLDIVKKMLEAGEKEARKQGVPMSMALVDAGGHLIAFNRMDNAKLISIQLALNKAFTAVFGMKPTTRSTEFLGSVHERFVMVGGGYPIIMNNEIIIGGIGVSGGTIEDHYVVRASLKGGGFTTDDVDATIADRILHPLPSDTKR